MVFEVTILGSSSATPTMQRHPTAQVLNVHERFFLLDCGEATQMQLNRYKIKSSRINHIFISHLHGDHYLGLVGLISTLHLLGRTAALHVYAPEELDEIIDLQLRVSQTDLRYPLLFHPLRFDKTTVVFEDDDLSVHSVPMNHRIPCAGFIFREKKKTRKLIKDKIISGNVPVEAFQKLKTGLDYTDSKGKIYKNSDYTTTPAQPRSYAYCSDTKYEESVISQIKNVDLLYHESTFMNDMADRAAETHHSTSLQAATIAQKAEVKKLLIGHFSARYKELDGMLAEARTIFPDTFLAIEGEKFKIGYE